MPQSTTIPRLPSANLLFAKNIPSYMSSTVISSFAPFHPVSHHNIYPHSHMTTIVFGFATHDNATSARDALDGMKIDHVVVKVEPYMASSSVRRIREKKAGGAAARRRGRGAAMMTTVLEEQAESSSAGAAGDWDEGWTEVGWSEWGGSEGFEMLSPGDGHGGSRGVSEDDGMSWTNIDQPAGAQSDQEKHPEDDNGTVVASDDVSTVTPGSPTPHATSDDVANSAVADDSDVVGGSILTPPESEAEHGVAPYVPLGLPTNSTTYLQHQHQKCCWFCQFRMRRSGVKAW